MKTTEHDRLMLREYAVESHAGETAAQGKTSDAEEALVAAFEPGCEAGCAHGHWTVDPVAWLTSRDRATAERVRRETIEECAEVADDACALIVADRIRALIVADRGTAVPS